MSDILNKYVQALLTEKVQNTLGPKCGKDASKTAAIARALFHLKSEGAAFRSYLARCMESMCYVSCKTNSDLLLKPEIRPEDRVQYCSYLLCYVNDILCIHHKDGVIQHLHQFILLKQGFGSHDMYLGAKLHKTRLCNRVWALAMSPMKYVYEAVKNYIAHLVGNHSGRFRLPMRAN